MSPTGGLRAPGAATAERPERRTVLQGDRRKVYRPLSAEKRHQALESGLAAYAEGNFFEAHELLEPAWMGTDNLAERALYQGLIKLAAGYVHALRGNPVGMARNLEGSRRHLATAESLDPSLAASAGIDLGRLIAEVDDRLVAVRALPDRINSNKASMLELADDAPLIR